MGRPRTLGGGTIRRDHGARGPHQPPRDPKPTPGRQQSPDAWPRSPIPPQTARSRLAGRVDLC